jgi:hypothetical protein
MQHALDAITHPATLWGALLMQRRVDDDSPDDTEGMAVMKKLLWIVVPMLLQGVIVGAIALVTFYYGAQHRFDLLDRRDMQLESLVAQEAKERARDISLVNQVDAQLLEQTKRVLDTVSGCQIAIARLESRHDAEKALQGRQR